MFKFKKSMEGIAKEENFECSCCGPAGNQASDGGCGCSQASSTVPMDCGCMPVNDKKEETNASAKSSCGCSGTN